jgi:hypothetical protein
LYFIDQIKKIKTGIRNPARYIKILRTTYEEPNFEVHIKTVNNINKTIIKPLLCLNIKENDPNMPAKKINQRFEQGFLLFVLMKLLSQYLQTK